MSLPERITNNNNKKELRSNGNVGVVGSISRVNLLSLSLFFFLTL